MAQKKLSEILRENTQSKEEQLEQVARINQAFNQIKLPVNQNSRFNQQNTFGRNFANYIGSNVSTQSNTLLPTQNTVNTKNSSLLSNNLDKDKIVEDLVSLPYKQQNEQINKWRTLGATEIVEAAQKAIAQKQGEKQAQKINESPFEAGKYIAGGIGRGVIGATSDVLAAGESLRGNDAVVNANKINREQQASLRQNINSGVTSTLGNVSETIGRMVPAIGSNFILPGSGLAVTGVTSGASSYVDTLNEDNSNKDKALITGLAKGTVEALTEKLTGGNVLGKGSLDDFATQFIGNKIKGKIGQKLASKAYEYAGEMLEEFVSDNAGYVIDKLVNNKDLPSFKEWLNQTNETNKDTFLTTLALNMLGLGGNTYNEVQNTVADNQAQTYLNEAQKIINQENLTEKLRNKVAQEAVSKAEETTTDNTQQLPTQQTDNRNVAINEINNSRINTQEKQQMIDILNNMDDVSSEDLAVIRETIQNANKANMLPTNENYKESQQRRQTYAKYKNDSSDYDSTVVNSVLATIPANRNGNRTVKQWLQAADNIGQQISDLSNEEIEKIAYKSWFDLQPTKNITQYDRQTKTNAKFQKLTSDEWVNTINNAVNQARENQQSMGQQNVQQTSQQTQEVAQQTTEQTTPVLSTNKTINPTETSQETTQGEQINWNEIERPEGKFRKHYQSIIESSNTTAEAKAIAKEMIGLDTYVPQSNTELLNKADARISTTNADTELNSLFSRVMNNEKVNDVDIAVGERLIEYYSKIGDSQHLMDAIHATAMAGTQAGRTVQAMALLNHMTPQGQVVWLRRSIDKANNELQQKYKKNAPQFDLTDDMVNRVLEAKNKEEMYKVLDDVYDELGEQVPKRFWEQVDEWRYFSMLANIKTHARNVIGNVAMGGVQRLKNKVTGAIEGTLAKFNPEMERTHTIKRASQKTRDFAKNDVKNLDVQTELGMNENKYNPQSRLQNARKTFKSDVLNNTLGKLFDINSNLLEIEDNIGLKSMYVSALSDYITANNIDVDNITDAQLAKARQHAVKEAQEATFHQASALATALNQLGRKNNIAKFALNATVPFKKTPINVAKTGIQYSPVGLMKSAVYDVAKVRNGDMSVNQYVDNVSKGLTGTGIALMGYALAQAGILKASGGDDDKKEAYDEEQGKQQYSIEVGGKSASLDWLSPVGIPLFIGAEINQQFNQSEKEKTSKSTDDDELLNQIVQKVGDIGTAFSNAAQPMTEMSMISGLTNVLSSYNKENAAGNMFVNSVKSYINQFVPTALSQIARTTDEYERTTKSTKTGILPRAIDTTVNQIKSKIPGLRQTLPTKTNIWGEDVKQSENLLFRAFNNFANPAIVKDISIDKVDKELNSLYAQTRESSIIPKSIDKKFTIDGQNYVYTNEEYAKYNKKYGETTYNLIKNLVTSSGYKNLKTDQKQEAIEKIYTYAKEQLKKDYAKQNNIKYDESTLSNVVNSLNKNQQANYFNYLANISGLKKESDKIDVLIKEKYSDDVKKKIYENSFGEDDSLYGIMKDTNIDINKYLKYKTQQFESDKEDDGTVKGKSVSGSKKEKVIDYVEKMNITQGQKLLLLGINYKLSNSERSTLANYVNGLNIDKNKKIEIYNKLQGFTVYKNGKVTW